MIFVVGSSRSGTTMMARILEKQGHVFFLREFHFFEELWTPADRDRALAPAEIEKLLGRFFAIQEDGYLNQGVPGRHAVQARDFVAAGHLAGRNRSHEIFQAFCAELAGRHGRAIACDQTPRNVFYLAEILSLFPEARIINMVRDPRDILYSQKYKWKRRFLGGKSYTPLRESLRVWLNYHPLTIAKLWNSAVQAAGRFSAETRLRTVRYEELLRQPEQTVREVCDFLGLAYVPTMLAIRQEGSSARPDSVAGEGILQDNSQKWRQGGLNAAEIFLCQKIAGKTMQGQGYEMEAVRPAWLSLAYYSLTFPVKLFLALLVNLGRMKSVVETIKRRLG